MRLAAPARTATPTPRASTAGDDLRALAAQVRRFIALEIPDTNAWNVNTNLEDEIATRTAQGFDDLEAIVDGLKLTVDGIVLPDGTLKPIGEWVPAAVTPTYVDASSFSLPGDQTADYRQGARLRVTLGAGATLVATIASVLYSGVSTRTVVALTTPSLTPALAKIETSIVRQSTPMVRAVDLLPAAVGTPALQVGAVTTAILADLSVTAAKLVDLAVTTAKLADAAVTNAKVAYQALQGDSVLAAGSVTGSTVLRDRTVTAVKIAPYTLTAYEHADGSIYGGVTRNHIVDGSVLGQKLADRTIPWNKIGVGNVRGSWNGAQNEIGQKTVSGSLDIADLSILAAQIADGQIFGGAYSRSHIANKSIWGDTAIANRSIWGANELAVQSVTVNELALNATLYNVQLPRTGNRAILTGQVVDIFNTGFPARGAWVFAIFVCNGYMQAGGPNMTANCAWVRDGAPYQGYNVTSHDPGEGTSGPSLVPATVIGTDLWAPAAGNHTFGVRVTVTGGKAGWGYTIQNADLLILAFG
jgi:hypothetical protein